MRKLPHEFNTMVQAQQYACANKPRKSKLQFGKHHARGLL